MVHGLDSQAAEVNRESYLIVGCSGEQQLVHGKLSSTT